MKNTCLVIVILLVTTFCCNYAQTIEKDEETNVEGNTAFNSNIKMTPKICEPNSIKMQECNRCRCSINGQAWLCTRKACPKFMRTIAPNEPGFVCTPNKIFKIECNTCTCNSNGNGAVCTEMACLQETLVISNRKLETIRTTEAPVVDGKCVPGTRWMDDCNWCSCTQTGFSICTQKGCPEKIIENFPTTTQPPTVDGKCVPGTRWKEDCNSCFCTSTGIGACTLRGCLGKINLPTIQTDINHVVRKRQAINQYQPTGGETIYTLEDLFNPNFSCIPSLSFKVECNTCWCAADGKRARFCTRIACNPKFSETIATSTKNYDYQIDLKFPD